MKPKLNSLRHFSVAPVCASLLLFGLVGCKRETPAEEAAEEIEEAAEEVGDAVEDATN